MRLPFALDTGEWLDSEPRAVFEEGAVYAAAPDAHDPRMAPVMTVAWLDEPPGVTLESVVEEDLARLLSEPGSLLVDREPVLVAGVEGVRTLCLHIGGGGPPMAREQWRTLAAGRRWTVSAMTALGDQPEWGPRLAEAATSFRVR